MLLHKGEGLLEHVGAAVTVPWGWAWQDLTVLAAWNGLHCRAKRMGLLVASVKASLVSLYCRSIQVERWRHAEWSKCHCIQKFLTLNLIQIATASPRVAEKTCLCVSQRSSDLYIVSSNSYKSGLVREQKYQLLSAKLNATHADRGYSAREFDTTLLTDPAGVWLWSYSLYVLPYGHFLFNFLQTSRL